MTLTNFWRGSVVALATLGMFVSSTVMAATPVAATATPTIKIVDVSLQQDNSLQGQVLNTQGQAVAESAVGLVQNGKLLAAVTTTDTGSYAFTGLTPGVYQIVTDEGMTVCRVWTAATAPPIAGEQVLVVNDGSVVRGQRRSLRDHIHDHPYLCAGVVATAIAVPIVIAIADGS